MPITDCEGLTDAKAVWDFTAGDARRFHEKLGALSVRRAAVPARSWKAPARESAFRHAFVRGD